MRRTYPFLVGVTGGLGSGKSMVCRFLSEMGCGLFESDRVAKELQLRDPEVIAGIKGLFGPNIYSFDGDGALALDRKKIALTVFSSPDTLQKLNALIHPKVFDEYCNAVQDARQRGLKILVKEAAILFESGGERGVDAVVVVVADNLIRMERAVRKGMGTPEEIRQRMLTQWPQERLIAKADYLLVNKGSLDELKKETERLLHTLLAAAAVVCGEL
ncbi:MAG: dephospho-CoA kinase [Chlorobium sp.]|nr:MAG: dephospho-CoA kinase [Chlorobium sp.]